MSSWIQKSQRNQRSNCQHLLDHRKSKRIPEKIYFGFIDNTKAFDCGSQQTVENSWKDGNTRPPYLPPEKPVCRSTVFWTLWERARVGWFGRMALIHVKYHMWNELPVQVRCMIQGAQSWCTGMTQRDGMGREVGGGFRTGNTCSRMADSCQCMAKQIQYCKVKKKTVKKKPLIKNKKFFKIKNK